MDDDLIVLLLAFANENAELRDQLATAQDMLVETAIDAGNLHALIEAVQIERNAWKAEAERLAGELAWMADEDGRRSGPQRVAAPARRL